ncbi:MAG: TIGR04255 family protein [Gemmatimonadales bacterium]|nr:TIGR04255 family protein [Gemmatimonadales bacterium]
MPFPSSPRVVFKRNPLAEVICQLRFPPILAISAVPSEFQAPLRDEYPEYTRGDSLVLPSPVGELLTSLNIPAPVGVRHVFSTDSTRGDVKREIALSTDFLALTDTRYKRWDYFLPELERARTTFEGIYKPGPYSRIGLRYTNIIDRSAIPAVGSHSWTDLIKPPLLDALSDPDVGGQVREFSANVVLDVPAVQGGKVRVSHGLRLSDGRESFVIDADFFTENRSAATHVYDILESFHSVSGNLFRWAITPRLFDALEPEPA